MKQNQKWTEPKIKIGAKGYVWFRFLDSDGNLKLIIKKDGNGKGVKPRERLAALKNLKDALTFQLNKGWNPITNEIECEGPDIVDIDHINDLTLREALNFAYDKKKSDWAKKTQQGYKATKKYMIKSAESLMIADRPIVELRRPHYLELLERIIKDRNLGSKGYNKYRAHLSNLLAKIEEYEIIEYNPVEKIKAKAKIKTFAHRPPTESERKTIIDHIKAKDPFYFQFINFLYATTIRPVEAQNLQIKDIDFKKQVIVLAPDEKTKGEKNKTNMYREMSIPNWLFEIIINDMKLDTLPKDYYVFSKNGKDRFVPGKKKLGRNASTYRWNQLVKKDLNLDVDQYSLKKMAGNDMVKLQVDHGVNELLQVAQKQMGHSSSKMTEVYVTEHKKVIDKVIRENMPRL